MSQAETLVLLCSPCAEDRAALAAMFRTFGVKLTPVRDIAGAAELLCRRRFSLALVDLDCDSHWTESIEQLHLLAPELPVVVYSRLPDEHRWIEALEAGAMDFISKPFSQLEVDWVWGTARHHAAHLAAS